MNWWGMSIGALLVILPIWVIRLTKLSLGYKVILTIAGLAVVWYAVTYGGAKRGLMFKG